MKKRTFTALLLAAAMCTTLLAGCGSKTAESSASADASASSGTEKKTFTVGFDASFPPYGYKDDSGEYVGFDLDLAQESSRVLTSTMVPRFSLMKCSTVIRMQFCFCLSKAKVKVQNGFLSNNCYTIK